MNRRHFLRTNSGLALAAAAGVSNAYTPTRYPHPDRVVFDPSFTGFIGQTPIQRLYTNSNMYWAEGPAWHATGRYLVWSDIPSNLQYRMLDEDDHVSVFRRPSNYSNGNTFDREGRQISFEHDTHRVVRYEADGGITVLAQTYNGKSLNAPNDGVVHPNGDLWFTDPGYGSLGEYEGHEDKNGSPQPHQKEAIYRLDMQTGKLHQVADDIYKPNGICFSPDYTRLYVADTGASHYGAQAPAVIKTWEVVDAKTLRRGRDFTSMQMEVDGEVKQGFADGIRCDQDGYIWSSAGWVGAGYDGVHVFNPDGERVAQIRLPEICANLCFGGVKRNRLYMTASQSIYACYVHAQGAHFC
ncbi:MAG: SMP-30/gluconolactonase/LRE family protein [Pseudomonadota bacterium]